MIHFDFQCSCGRHFSVGGRRGRYKCVTCGSFNYFNVAAETYEAGATARLAAAKLRQIESIKRDSPVVAIVKRFRVESDTGVGDTVERLIEKAGGRMLKRFKAKLEKLGIDCGCTSRRDWLNRRYPYQIVNKSRSEDSNLILKTPQLRLLESQ